MIKFVKDIPKGGCAPGTWERIIEASKKVAYIFNRMEQDQFQDKEIIICAAVKDDTGGVWPGKRHDDCFFSIHRHLKQRMMSKEAQGFITSRNRFVDRVEARRIFIESGAKPFRGKFTLSEKMGLASEDLY